MKKNTFKIKNHFANLGSLVLIVLFISVFTEVNAQSTQPLPINNRTNPANLKQDNNTGATQISTVAIEPSAPLVVTDEAPGTAHVEGNINTTGANVLNSDGSIKMPEQPSEKATQKNQSDKKQPK